MASMPLGVSSCLKSPYSLQKKKPLEGGFELLVKYGPAVVSSTLDLSVYLHFCPSRTTLINPLSLSSGGKAFSF